MSGGMADSSTALATRAVPWWPMYRATSRGVADEDDVVQVEVLDEAGQVVGVGREVVAVPRLGGAAAAASVVGDGPVPRVGDQLQLGIPRVGGQRPAVAEHHWLPAS